jgi:kynurenine formamidase
VPVTDGPSHGAGATRPPRARAPELSNWGVFGDEDEIGTVNHLTPEAVRRGVACARLGLRFPLNLPLDLPSQRRIGRPPFEKRTHLLMVDAGGVIANDDHVVLATQGSSQWDALVHVGCEEDGVDGVFYNGFGREAVDAGGFARRCSIERLAESGIAGRGVLLDVARHVNSDARPLADDYVIGPDEAEACAAAQGVELLPGDIVCFRTGWIETYLDADEAGRDEIMRTGPGGQSLTPGISPDMAVLAHRQRWAAVAADNPAVEATPFRPDNRRSAHVRMLRNLGLPFGEYFDFRALAASCHRDREWTFLFVAVPLRVPGGMGSPANAMALR